MRHETTHLSSTVDSRGTPAPTSRAALPGCVYPAAVPDLAGQWAGPTPRPACPAAEVCRPERAPCDPCLPHPWAGLVIGPIAAPPAHAGRARCGHRRAGASAPVRTASYLWQLPPYLDAALSGGRLLGTGPAPVSCQHRDHPRSAQATGPALAAGHARDHQPRAPICVKQAPRSPNAPPRPACRLGAGLCR
jgi:hypothetical protein